MCIVIPEPACTSLGLLCVIFTGDCSARTQLRQGNRLHFMAYSPDHCNLAELADPPSAGFPLQPAATPAHCPAREPAAATPAGATTAGTAVIKATAPAAAAGAAAASDKQPSELDQGALEQVLIRLPRNVVVLAAKVLNKGWSDWVYQQLGSRRGKRVVIRKDGPQSSYIPLWRIKQQVGLWAAPKNKGLLASGAAARGELEDLQWMISQGYGKGSKMGVAAAAAEAGQLRVLEWLLLEGYGMDKTISSAAARGGQLTVLQWLRQKGCSWNAEVLSAAIAAGPHMHVVDWALEEGCPVDASVCHAAAAVSKGGLQLLQQMHAKGAPLNADTCAVAAEVGNLEILQWLRRKGCPWDEKSCLGAALKGHLEVLQWARSKGCPCRLENIVWQAARGGHLKILQWAREQGCPMSGYTCYLAAEGGHLEVLQSWRSQTGSGRHQTSLWCDSAREQVLLCQRASPALPESCQSATRA